MTPDRLALEEFYSKAPGGLSLDKVDLGRLPKHIAIIMDGNGRWAKSRALARGFGHRAGVVALKEVITASVRLGIDALTVYAFSTENWTRPTEEVDLLMGLFAKTLLKELPLLMREDVRLQYLGDMDALPANTKDTFLEGLTATAGNKGMVLAVAVNYGARDELLGAIRSIAADVVEGGLSFDDIDSDLVDSRLYTYPLPDPELLIRTSGEKRLSNFLLWQCAYTEFVWNEKLWPDYDRWDLLGDIVEYQGRQRRFGGLGDE